MNTYQNLINYIKEFNKNNEIELSIDTIRITFSKQYKLEKLKELGIWHKIDKQNNKIKNKLKRRLEDDEITSAYQLENYSIYYYNKKDPTKKYRYAEMVIFALQQYYKETPPENLIKNIINHLTYGKSKNECNIDVCFDMNIKPNLMELSKHYEVNQYCSKDGVFGETYYIYETYNPMIEKITIYNKALKNSLEGILFRIEAKIHIPNMKALALPLHDFKSIISMTKD